MKNKLMLSVALLMSTSVVSYAASPTLEVKFRGAVSDVTCEPGLMDDGGVVANNIIDFDIITAATASAIDNGIITDTTKNFKIYAKDAGGTCTPTGANIWVDAQEQIPDVIKNAGSAKNIGVHLVDSSDREVIGKETNYTFNTGGPYTVDYKASLYHIGDSTNPVTVGTIIASASFTVAYY